MHRQKQPPLQSRVRLAYHRRVFLMVLVLSPPVEHEVVVRHLSRGVLHTNRPGIPHPAAISWHAEKFHRHQFCACFFENPSHPSFGLAILYQHKDPLHLRQHPHNLRNPPPVRRELPRPVRQLVRPTQPCCLVLLPLRRHPVSQLGRPLLFSCSFHKESEFITQGSKESTK